VTDEQVEKAVRRPQAHLPLYLVLFCSEASLHAIFESIGQTMDTYPNSIEEMWTKKTLKRLEGLHGEHEPLVKFFMQNLVASESEGMSLSLLKETAKYHDSLKTIEIAEQSRLIDKMADNLRTFLYTQGGDSGVISLRSRILLAESLRMYAPSAAWRSNTEQTFREKMTRLDGLWKNARSALQHIEQKPKEPCDIASVCKRAHMWTFDKCHRHLQVKAEKLSALGTISGTATALVSPDISSDCPSYFEVNVETCTALASIKIGFLYSCNKDDIKKVPEERAASQNKNGWLYNSKNGARTNEPSFPNRIRKLCSSGWKGLLTSRFLLCEKYRQGTW